MSTPAVYEIRFLGHLPSQWSAWFEGLEIANHPGGEATLSGPFRDQAELYGVLDKLRDLNLPLIYAKRKDD